MTMLKWVERSLYALGVVLAVWCSVVLIRAEYIKRLPLPEPHQARTAAAPTSIAAGSDGTGMRAFLPGDAGSTSDGNEDAEANVETGAWLARLDAPSLGLMATVLEGSGNRVLDRAAGHIEHTALPGTDGNVGIAGHRDTIFRPLQHARAGQLLRLTTADQVLLYAVSSTTVVDPSDVGVLAPTSRPTLTLVTCYPFRYFGSAPKRFIVRAHLVDSRAR
jgi:LPXTG-site transpeptidase (sortase) family protein